MGQFLPHTPTNQLGHDPLKHRVLLFSLSLTYLFCIFSFDFADLAEIFRRFVRDPAQRTQLLFAFASRFREATTCATRQGGLGGLEGHSLVGDSNGTAGIGLMISAIATLQILEITE